MPADGEWDWAAPLCSSSDEEVTSQCRRACERCERPRSVCLCPWLPPAPLALAGRLIILQHPHEKKKRLATVPVLQKCIDGVAVLRSRYYRPGHPDHCPLKEALEGAAAGRYPLLVLFPGAGAQDVREVAAQLHAAAGCSSSNGGSRDHSAVEEQAALVCGQQEQPGGQHLQQQQQQTGVQQPGMLQQSCSQPCSTKQDDQGGRQAPAVTCQLSTPPAGRQSGDPLYALLVIDGTWKEAKEMYKTVVPHALSPGGPGLRVQLPPPAPVLPAEQPAEQAQEHSAALQQQAQEQQQVAASEAGEQQPQEARAGEAAAAAAGVDQAPPVLLRMEPMPGCLTTCEAVARTLGHLEPEGSAVRQAVLRPLAQLANFQAQWDPAVAGRLAAGAGYSQSRCRMGMGKLGILAKIP